MPLLRFGPKENASYYWYYCSYCQRFYFNKVMQTETVRLYFVRKVGAGARENSSSGSGFKRAEGRVIIGRAEMASPATKNPAIVFGQLVFEIIAARPPT